MSDYRDRINRERAQQARQLRQDYAEVQALYQAKLAQGMTQAQAATSQSGDVQLAQQLGINLPKTYTVKSGDNLASIAQATGNNPQDILAANPDVSHIQTGMVLQTPQTPTLPKGQPANPVTSASGALNPQAAQGSEAWRIQQQNSGTMAYKPPIPVTSQRPLRPGQAQQNAGTPPQGYYNANLNQPRGTYGQPLGTGFQPLQNPYPLHGTYGQPNAVTTKPTQATPLAPTNQGGFINGVNPYSRFGQDYEKSLVLEKFMQQTMNQGYIPSNEVARFMEINGYIRPSQNSAATSQFSSSGNYTIKQSGGGGGGTGGIKTPIKAAAYNNNNLPAFSSGAGFGGLVNWRV